ncbi:MAG: NAD(P)H-quinone oxidoreductase [Gammaproteobacteria bacterium]
MLPKVTKVIEIPTPGGPEALVAGERPMPKPGSGEVLIKVAAAGVNRPDCLQRAGSYPPPPGASDIPGLEVAGTIAHVNADVSEWQAGDEVCALVNGGGYAAYCTVPAAQCLPVPKGLDMVQAAALPETFFTVWTNVFQRGRLQSGETLLVHGGASGIGTTAIQLGVASGAQVFTTVRTDDKQRSCEALGATRAINYKKEDFVEVVQDLTDGRGVDVILDMVGGEYIVRNIKSLATEGRLVQIAFLAGSKVTLNYLPVMLKRLTLTGSTLRVQSTQAKGAIAAALWKKVWPLIEAGRVAPQIFRTFSLDEAPAAHRLMESNEVIGKLVLVV